MRARPLTRRARVLHARHAGRSQALVVAFGMVAGLVGVTMALGCDDDDVHIDAGFDGGAPGDATVEPDAGGLVVTPPEPPRTSPCPDGWMAQPLASDATVIACTPFASAEPDVCAAFEAHFPGEPGCVDIGSACPVDGWPTMLPTDAIYVDPDAAPAGDGSRVAPFARFADALAAAVDDAVIALHTGVHSSTVSHIIDKPIHVVGACASQTHLDVRAFAVAVQVTGGAHVELTDVGLTGMADLFRVEAGATATLTRVVVFGSEGVGVHAQAGTLIARSLLVRDMTGLASVGARASDGGVLELERAAIRTTDDHGITSSDSTVRLTDVVVDQRSSGLGAGIRLIGGNVTLDRIGIYGATEVGVNLVDTTATLRDIHVHDTVQPDDFVGAVAVGATSDSDVTVDRLFADGNTLGALTVTDGAMLHLRDSIVVDTVPNGMGRFGRGLEVATATVSIDRVVFARQSDIAVFAYDGANIEAHDLSVVDTRSDVASGGFGRAVHAQQGATVAIDRARFNSNREVSISASSAGTTVALTDVRITDTEPRACVTTTCPGAGAGIGIAAIDQAYVSAERFEVSHCALAGVQLAAGGTMDLRRGLIADNPVGANIQTEPFDVTRLAMGVTYRNNGQNLDASRLTVPAAPTGL